MTPAVPVVLTPREHPARAAFCARMGIETILLVLGGAIVLAIVVAAMKRNRR